MCLPARPVCRRARRAFTVTLLGLTVLWCVPGAARQAGEAPQPSIRRLLERAGRALGGEGGLDRVRTLQLEADVGHPPPKADRTPFRMVFAAPNRFHWEWESGGTAHTLAGDRFWQNTGNPAPLVERARTNVRRQYWRMAVALLLGRGIEPPLEVTAPARRAGAGHAGAVLRFAGPEGFQVDLLLDPASGLPLRLLEDDASLRNPGVEGGQRWELENHAPAGGVLVPRRIRQTIGRFTQTYEVRRVIVNDPIPPDLFEPR